MPPLAVAAVGAAVGIGGAVLSASAQKKAASKAAGAQADASAANIQLAKDTYAQNAQRLDPTVNSGQVAGNAIMSILGFPAASAAPAGVQTLPSNETQEPVSGTGDFFTSALVRSWQQRIASGQATIDQAPAFIRQHLQTSTPSTPATTPMTSANALSAFDTFRNSDGYKFRFDQGVTAEQQGMGALGAFDSGATRKALTEYGQNFASNELGTWMDRLSQQQGFGLSAASALAGVSQNMAGATMNANNANATAAGNAALVRGAANQNMYGQIAGALGGLASSFFPKR